jgi:hypothetical protein
VQGSTTAKPAGVRSTNFTQQADPALALDLELFACTSIVDYNGNGIWEDDEFVDVKDRFRSSEHITLVVRFLMGQRGRQLRYRIRNDRGFTVGRGSQRVGYDDAAVAFELGAGKLSPGVYTVEFAIGTQRLGVMPVTVF